MSTILFISVFGSRTNDTGMDGMSYSVSRQSGVAGSVLLIQFLGGGISNSSGTTNITNGKYCLSVSYKWQAQLVLNYGCQLFSGLSRCLCVKKIQLMSKNFKTLDLLFVTSWKNVIKRETKFWAHKSIEIKHTEITWSEHPHKRKLNETKLLKICSF